MKCRPDQVQIALVTPDGRLREMCIPKDAAHIARQQGWMVFEDFTAPTPTQQPDED